MQEQKGLDINAIVEELDQEFNAEAEDQPEESVEEPEVEEKVLEEEEVLEDEAAEEDESEEPVINSDDEHKRNEAFKRLREEREYFAQSDQFLTDLAAQYGLTKEQLMQRVQADRLKKQAKDQGVPENQLLKMREMEQRLVEVEQSKARELFNIRAENFAQRYELDEKQMIQLFEESGKLGLNILQNPDLLEVAYKAVNYDSAVDKGRQKQLETTKKRRSTSAGATGTKGRQPVVTDEEQWEKEIDSLLKDLNL